MAKTTVTQTSAPVKKPAVARTVSDVKEDLSRTQARNSKPTKAVKKEDTYSYKGWLVSDRFLKRCFAILGHSLVASLIIYGIIMAVCLVFFMIFGFSALVAALIH
ncbi:hypothetical protein COV20_01560 [Candidatus Woesearchaeota archaeon CG10_big_fil_rev_8_21_14_0_10_45_16]|nr:MAG: hypothetical protein COV20_01560 [Candidatus Woesearchaeota archaeon CG10_big_fil_rev_8_21_14_0_10_45_16]